MQFANPGSEKALVKFKVQYENYIRGEWVAPRDGQYMDNITPVTGEVYCRVARSGAKDIDLALDAAHAAADSWGATSVAERSNILLQVANRIEDNLQMLAVAETWENGKAVRETLGADIPLCVDHFRYFAGCLRAQEGSMAELDANTVSYHLHEPLGVVGQIIPWNFPLLMAAWKLAPALAGGNCVVLKPAEQTPTSILLLMELIGDLFPPGVINIVNGIGNEAGNALATSSRLAKLAFTGSTPIGHHILRCAAETLIPSTVELGGKSPNLYFEDVISHGEEFLNKCIEGLVLGFFNQGEVCTCPSRALIQKSIYNIFIEKVIERTQRIVRGHPLDTDTQIGAQVSREQFDKILNYIDVGKNEGAKVLLGGNEEKLGGSLRDGFYIQPTLLLGQNDMRVFQDEIFGPVVGITTFETEDEAIAIANDTEYGLGSGLWTRDMNRAYRVARSIKAGRVWTNCYHAYPAHAAFGGYKKSGIGRETHKIALSHYQQTKNILVSYDPNPMGLF
ncbi:MAG: aldehyde dehydrogenase [Myxococcales bacterium]|nr:aldehyde dehydrogenase [Myxococcales bacterium]